MINAFYTCLCNQSATALSQRPGSDVVDRSFSPVARHDSVQQLADIVFGSQVDHQMMMYAMAKRAVQSSPASLLYRRDSLEHGYTSNDLTTFFWKTLTTPRTSAMQSLQYSGNYVTPLFQINIFNASLDGTDVVLSSPDGTEVVRVSQQGPNDTAVSVVSDRSVFIRIPHDRLPTTITWASKPVEPYLQFFEREVLFIGAVGDQAISQPSCFAASDLKTLRAQLVSTNSTEAFAAAATIIAGHTAHLAAINL